MQHNIESIANQFQLSGRLLNSEPFGSGHINDTFSLTCDQNGTSVRYILQRINHEIFKNPVGLMENVVRVTSHIKEKLLGRGKTESAQRMVTVISTIDGQTCYEDSNGNYWRIYTFVENAKTYDTIDTPEQAYEAARMFGWFQNMLIDLPGGPLHETIPDFHNTPKRLQAFRQALDDDTCNRAKDIKPEIDFALEHAAICNVLLDLAAKGQIPVRVTHNDTKINNVMLDEKTDKGICVIDLDTVMPGLSLYDVGDMIRTATSPTEEDEIDVSKVKMRMEMFEALIRGFCEETRAFLTPAEKKHLAFSGKLITFEQYIRFLGDYIAGDVYYKINRPSQNLDRSRTQLKLIESIIEQEDQMNAVVEKILKE